MLKQKLQSILRIRRPLGILVVGLVLGVTIVAGGLVKADQYDEQIKALQSQNAATAQSALLLAGQAASYQDEVDKLSSQINSIRQTILDYQHQSDELQKQIDDDEKQLVQQKQVLGEDIKAMYLEGEISTLEILASSKDLSEFVDKAEYRNTVQSKVKATVDKITQLKLELQTKQRAIQNLIKDQQTQQAQLDDSLAMQSNLLNMTNDQKNAKNAEIRQNNAQISALRMQQLAANHQLGGSIEAGDPGHGGYPATWNNAPQDSMLDSWGMLNRECVSYTAWKVFQAYGYMPYWGGHGNANQWPASARADGIPTGSTPKPNSVAISMGGAYGHAMWVEAVSGSFIHVSQYNFDLNGHYSEMTINGSGLTYIYFGE